MYIYIYSYTIYVSRKICWKPETRSASETESGIEVVPYSRRTEAQLTMALCQAGDDIQLINKLVCQLIDKESGRVIVSGRERQRAGDREKMRAREIA